MIVVFTTDNSGSDVGFQASYSSCTVLSSARGTISSPNYPNYYDNLDNFCWVIRRPDGFVISLFFNAFSTSLDDYMRVFDGNSTNSRELLSASGSPSTLPNPVTSSSNAMLVVFSSDYKFSGKGFQATYRSVFSG